MTIDPAWEAEHARRPWGKYPHAAVVEFIGRHYGFIEPGKLRSPYLDALDLGAGAGASTVFVACEEFKVLAVDGSRSALDRLADRVAYNGVGPIVSIYERDLCALTLAPETFDAALDICALCCLNLNDAERIIYNVSRWLKPGGRFLSVMASTECDEGVHAPFNVRQIDRHGIDSLFSGFSDLFVGKHTRLTRRGFISEWVVEVQK